MKIYTKSGDSGETSLFGGRRVAKYQAQVMAYGEVDEANAAIGVVLASLPSETWSHELQTLGATIQNRLFDIGAELACSDPKATAKLMRTIVDEDIDVLEKHIDHWQDSLKPLKNFILPGGSVAASHCQLARTICRRAERTAAELPGIRPEVQKYLNRLSDLLFIMARYVNHKQGIAEPEWEKD